MSRELLAQLAANHHNSALADHRESSQRYLAKLRASLEQAETGTAIEAFREVAESRNREVKQPPAAKPHHARLKKLLDRHNIVLERIKSIFPTYSPACQGGENEGQIV